jgi:3-deoxy-D-manno-octulosonic-acid transferase
VAGEEEQILEVWRLARAAWPGLRLILAPRKPARFQEVAELLAPHAPFRASAPVWPADEAAWAGTPVLLLDTLGELASAYRIGTLALVGGGWGWHGGHNPLEPVRWGLPTLLGPGFGNFEDLVRPLQAAGLVEVVAEHDLAARVQALLAVTARRPADSSQSVRYPECLQGALGKTLELLKNILPEPR